MSEDTPTPETGETTWQETAQRLMGRRVAVRTSAAAEPGPTGRLTYACNAYLDLMELADGRRHARVQLDTVTEITDLED